MIDLERARELLKAAVETQGRDFVYQIGSGGLCANVPLPGYGTEEHPKRKTGCVVGTAMKLSGEIPEDGWDPYMFGTVMVFDRFLTASARDYFGRAQWMQDNGKTWGEAYDEAEQWAAEYTGVYDS